MNHAAIVEFIRKWMIEILENSKLKGFVIGVSGGIDSALSSTLTAITGYPTLCMSLPIHQGEDQLIRARNHISWLESQFENVSHIEIDLTNTFEAFRAAIGSNYSELSLANSRARLRMTTLYSQAQVIEGLVVGTGNLIEDYGVFFFTKWGDGAFDLNPIGDLYKSEVRSLAECLGVSKEIIMAKPTDGLWGDSRSDEDQIGATYDELEWVMKRFFSPESSVDTGLSHRQKEVWEIFKKRHEFGRHKILPIPVCKLRDNFGL